MFPVGESREIHPVESQVALSLALDREGNMPGPGESRPGNHGGTDVGPAVVVGSVGHLGSGIDIGRHSIGAGAQDVRNHRSESGPASGGFAVLGTSLPVSPCSSETTRADSPFPPGSGSPKSDHEILRDWEAVRRNGCPAPTWEYFRRRPSLPTRYEASGQRFRCWVGPPGR